MITGDTITAISSAVGVGARLIVRLGGPRATQIAAEICPAGLPAASRAARTTLEFAGLHIPACIYRFVAPHSYSGEDLIEFHLPGNPLLTRMLLDELIRRGARQAEPGEFTARAFFTGRIDLSEAEGVAAAISASGEAELSAARQLLAGELARRLSPLMDSLAETLALVEAGIDFSDENIAFIEPAEVLRRCEQIDAALQQLLRESARFERLSHEPQVVMIGRPNAGKSTLLNALAGETRAVVSEVAGTTRDVLWAQVPLQRGFIRLFDLAGLEESSPAIDDASPQASIARQMQTRALSALASADLIMLLIETADPKPMLSLPRRADLIVRTKADLPGQTHSDGALAISVHTGENLDTLRRRLDELAFGRLAESPTLALNARHLQAIEQARSALHRIPTASTAGSELLAIELREALDHLGAILGRISPDDLLGRVFARFCIGK